MDDLVPTWLDQLQNEDPQQQEGALRKLIYHSTRGIIVADNMINQIYSKLQQEINFSKLQIWHFIMTRVSSWKLIVICI